MKKKSVERELKAPCDGMLLFINDYRKGASNDNQDEYVVFYVVSYFDNHNDLDQWYKNLPTCWNSINVMPVVFSITHIL